MATLIQRTMYKELPPEEGKVYETKFQTKEKFKVEKVIRKVISGVEKIIRVDGYYVGREALGLCPLPHERLNCGQVADETIMVCSECGTKHEPTPAA